MRSPRAREASRVRGLILLATLTVAGLLLAPQLSAAESFPDYPSQIEQLEQQLEQAKADQEAAEQAQADAEAAAATRAQELLAEQQRTSQQQGELDARQRELDALRKEQAETKAALAEALKPRTLQLTKARFGKGAGKNSLRYEARLGTADGKTLPKAACNAAVVRVGSLLVTDAAPNGQEHWHRSYTDGVYFKGGSCRVRILLTYAAKYQGAKIKWSLQFTAKVQGSSVKLDAVPAPSAGPDPWVVIR